MAASKIQALKLPGGQRKGAGYIYFLGEFFSPDAYVNKLIEGPIHDLYEATCKELFARYGPPKP